MRMLGGLGVSTEFEVEVEPASLAENPPVAMPLSVAEACTSVKGRRNASGS